MRSTRRLLLLGAGILAVALVLTLAVRQSRPDHRDRPGSDVGRGTAPLSLDTVLVRQLPLPLLEYLADCREDEPRPGDPVDFHSHTVRCTERLSAVLEVLQRSDTSDRPAVELALAAQREQLRRLVEDQAQSLQTRPVRDAIQSLSVVMAQLWEVRYREVEGLSREVAQSRRAARSISNEIPLADQEEVVEDFFDRAGRAVILMARAELER